jgi:drug/metabolite transporter (DMT)-like permease
LGIVWEFSPNAFPSFAGGAVSSHAAAPGHGSSTTAKLLMVLLGFSWGSMWVASALALRDMHPWTLRLEGAVLGAGALFIVAVLTGRNVRVPHGQRMHVFVAGMFNVLAFSMFSVFAQMSGATSRVVIVNYSMPIWASLLARFLLNERLTGIRMLAFWLCVVGLSVLLWPQVHDGVPISFLYAFGCSISFSFAAVYVKWVKLAVDPLISAAWQLLLGVIMFAIGTFLFERHLGLWPPSLLSLGSVLFIGLIGVGLAHFLWWTIVSRLPASTAAIGSLLTPVFGVTASVIVLGERLSVADVIGFAMIFAAAACVLLQPTPKRVVPAE